MENNIDIVANIVTIATAIPTIIGILDGNNIFIIILLVIIFYLYSYYRLTRCIRNVGSLENRLSENISDLYYTMEDAYAKNTDINLFNKLVTQNLKECVNIISEVLNEYTRKKTTVTIRYFEEKFDNFDDAKVSIIAYSENCGEDRKEEFKKYTIKKKAKIVKENTDFKELVGAQRTLVTDYFYKGNLEKYHSDLGKNNRSYNNTTENWRDYYSGKIVVPIKFESNKLSSGKDEEVENIVGFLTADTLSKTAFSKRKMRFYINLMQSYAVRLYVILDKYSDYLAKMERGEKNDRFYSKIDKIL